MGIGGCPFGSGIAQWSGPSATTIDTLAAQPERMQACLHCNHAVVFEHVPHHDEARPMASITIRNLDDDVKTRLRVRAAEHHRSMEEEVRIILRDAVNGRHLGPRNLATFTRECFASLGGVELELRRRGPMREPPDFS